MLELRRKAYLRQLRRTSALQAQGALLALALAALATRLFDSAGAAVLLGLGGVLALLVALNFIIQTVRPEVPWVQVVFDQPLALPEPWKGLGYSEVLQLYWDELERRARAGGVRRLGEFSGAIQEGAARFEPAQALETVEALLRTQPEPELAQALEALRARLELARERGARFCVMSSGAWSGAIETNLRLYWR